MGEKSDLESLARGDAARVIDASGLSCPMPLLKAKQGLNLCDAGELIEVRATDPQSVRDFHAFIDLTDHELVAYECIKSEASGADQPSSLAENLDRHCFVIRKAYF